MKFRRFCLGVSSSMFIAAGEAWNLASSCLYEDFFGNDVNEILTHDSVAFCVGM